MKIENIQQNYLQQQRLIRKSAAAPQFTGGGLGKLTEQITESLPGKKAIAKMKKLEWLKGEIGGILITAVGTGTVAPLVIGTNPLVRAKKGATEEEKKKVINTKWYTAMRQPLSAILAIIFQASILKYIDKFLDNIFNIRENSKRVDLHLDQCELNNKSYLKTLVKKEFNDQNIKKPSLFNIFTKGYNKTMNERTAFNEKFNARVDEISNQQIEDLAKYFQETDEVKVGSRKLDNKTLAELYNKKIDDYVEDAKLLKINNEGLVYYSERAQNLIENEKRLKEIFKDYPKEEKALKAFLEKHIQNESNSDLVKILEDILERPADLRASRISRTLSRIETIKQMCNGQFFNKEIYIDAMSLRNAELDKIITKLELNKFKEPEKVTTQGLKKAIDKLADICTFKKSNKLLDTILHDTKTFDSANEVISEKIYKDLIKAYKKLIDNKYKGFNQISKITIGALITLPITCTALNIIYPRFMETFFPKLAGVKKDGGDK